MNFSRQWHDHNTGVVSNVELNSFAPIQNQSQNRLKNKPSIHRFHIQDSCLKEGRGKFALINEGDLKRQNATTTDTTVHVISFYCKEKIITSQCVHSLFFWFPSTKPSRLLWHDRAGVCRETLAGGTPF